MIFSENRFPLFRIMLQLFDLFPWPGGRRKPSSQLRHNQMLLTMHPAGTTMKISDLLSPTDVMIDVRASNKRLLLQEFAAKAADSLGLPVDQIAPYLLKREELGSTGIGRGVAIPHARLPNLQRPHGLLAKLKQPIEFDAIDSQAVDIVFVLLLPAAVENVQLSALALVARTLRPPENLARLRSAKNSSELYSAIA
jgi:PTS system nitrogen regulatory IIA component